MYILLINTCDKFIMEDSIENCVKSAIAESIIETPEGINDKLESGEIEFRSVGEYVVPVKVETVTIYKY